MKVIARHMTRKTNGGIVVRDEVFETDAVVIGRSTDCDIELSDGRVLLQHARVVRRSGNFYVEGLVGETISVNGHLVQAQRISELDRINIGPYVLIIEPAEGNADVVISIDLQSPQDDDLDSLLARSSVNISDAVISKRQLSWAMFVAALLVLLAIPLMSSWMGRSDSLDVAAIHGNTLTDAPTAVWNTGDLSSVHRFFGNSCEICHTTPFVPVQDTACSSCHPKTFHHADPHIFNFASFADTACQGCHKEHQGEVSIARSDQDFCASCHQDLTDHTPDTTLINATDFGNDHPEFRPTVVDDVFLHSLTRKLSLKDSPGPVEKSGLRFNHEDHLRPIGVKHPTQGNVQLECDNCHVSDDGGVSMLPISFEKHCHECHKLNFDEQLASRELLHGDPERLFDQISDIYQAVAMRGGYIEPEAPRVLRRRPGTPLSEPEKDQARDWAEAKANEVINGRFGRGLCDECHTVYDSPSSSVWLVEPVHVATHWFPKATFNHRKHTSMNCVTCHDVEASISSEDILMPSIDTCRSCHGGERAADRVPTTCIDCHRFHQKDLDPMHPAAASEPPFESALVKSKQ